MTRNARTLDRVLRILAGVALLVLAAFDQVGWLGAVGGLALIASGVLGWCAIYSTLGLSTCRVKQEN